MRKYSKKYQKKNKKSKIYKSKKTGGNLKNKTRKNMKKSKLKKFMKKGGSQPNDEEIEVTFVKENTEDSYFNIRITDFDKNNKEQPIFIFPKNKTDFKIENLYNKDNVFFNNFKNKEKVMYITEIMKKGKQFIQFVQIAEDCSDKKCITEFIKQNTYIEGNQSKVTLKLKDGKLDTKYIQDLFTDFHSIYEEIENKSILIKIKSKLTFNKDQINLLNIKSYLYFNLIIENISLIDGGFSHEKINLLRNLECLHKYINSPYFNIPDSSSLNVQEELETSLYTLLTDLFKIKQLNIGGDDIKFNYLKSCFNIYNLYREQKKQQEIQQSQEYYLGDNIETKYSRFMDFLINLEHLDYCCYKVKDFFVKDPSINEKELTRHRNKALLKKYNSLVKKYGGIILFKQLGVNTNYYIDYLLKIILN